MDPGMNNLLKWSLENTSTTSPTSPPPAPRTTSLNAEALKVLMGGPSDADLMRESMAAIQSADISLEDKLVAFDNFEQLIESIDNANNMQTLGLWTPLVALLSSEEEELRRMAAWCVGTAVQNNVKAQERLLVVNGIPPLVKLALHDHNEPVRRKAIYAISSAVRNYQPALDAALRILHQKLLPKPKPEAEAGAEAGAGAGAGAGAEPQGPEGRKSEGARLEKGVDAGDMEAVDFVIECLRRGEGLGKRDKDKSGAGGR